MAAGVAFLAALNSTATRISIEEKLLKIPLKQNDPPLAGRLLSSFSYLLQHPQATVLGGQPVQVALLFQCL